MAWTQAQLDTLKNAYAQGVRSVSFSDRTTTFQSQAEMSETIRTIEAELSRSAIPPRKRLFKLFLSRGL